MIHTVTLNPAVDMLLYLTEFKKNVTNRLSRIDTALGGKGTHVSYNLKLLGLDSIAYGVSHGETGRQICSLLKKRGIIENFFHKKGEINSRTNYLLIEDNADCCILAAHGIPLTDSDIEEVLRRLESSMQENDILVLSGDAANCPNPSVYNLFIQRTHKKHPRVFLDTSGASLKECLKESPFLIKPNLDELSDLCQRPLNSESEIIDAITSLDRYHIEVIAVSLGKEGSIVKYKNRFFSIKPPVVQAINTIGCGDCFLSGLIYGFHQALPIEETLRIATAASAATAEENSSVGFQPERYQELLNQVHITPIREVSPLK